MRRHNTHRTMLHPPVATVPMPLDDMDVDIDTGFAATMPPPDDDDLYTASDAKAGRFTQSQARAHVKTGGQTSAFASLGIHSVRAFVIALDTMTPKSSWQLGDSGSLEEFEDRQLGNALPGAMATILKLNNTPPEQTMTRRLDPRNWAFAWPIDDRHVAVVEASYHLPHIEHSEADTARLRAICDAAMCPSDAGANAVPHSARPLPAAATRGAQSSAPSIDSRSGGQIDWSEAQNPSTVPGVFAADGSLHNEQQWPLPNSDDDTGSATAVLQPAALPPAGHSRSWLSRKPGRVSREAFGVLAVLLLCMAAAVPFLVGHFKAGTLQQQTDATLQQRLSDTLAGGDYGEVQDTLDALSQLGLFDAAVVTNARNRVVAIVGKLPGVRVGDPLPAAAMTQSRVISLNQADLPSAGRVIAWGAPAATHAASVSQQRLLSVAGLLGAAAVAALLVIRMRRRITAKSDHAA